MGTWRTLHRRWILHAPGALIVYFVVLQASIEPGPSGQELYRKQWLVGCRFESNYLLLGPPTIGGVFLRDPSPYLLEYEGKPRKTQKTARSTSTTGV